ncbi:MAG: hypothetical protein RLZZ232_3071 [Planctomycetota bacterium]
MPKWHLAVAASKGVIIAPELGSRGNQGAWHLKPGRGVKVSRWCLCESVVSWKIGWIDCVGCVDCGEWWWVARGVGGRDCWRTRFVGSNWRLLCEFVFSGSSDR